MKSQKDFVLDKFRRNIDSIDRRIVSLISKRFEIVRRIGTHKATHGLLPCDKEREKEILARLAQQCALQQIDAALVTSIFKLIFRSSKHEHARIAQRRKHV